MQILSSGSFINLENQEKIEQLIFTAREIAQAAVETDGFVNQEENNRRLALEIWQGAEYMCRDHEEANVKNIFINNFLERLRELGAASKMPDVLPENSAGESSSKPTDETTATRDEFLGFVGATEFSEQGSVGRASLAQENSLEAAQIDVIAPINNRVSDIQDEKTDEAPAESDELSTETASEIGTAKPEGDKPEQMSQSSESEKVEEINVDNSPKHPVGAIVLPEKEPYRWSSCTVTATIQLLPTETGVRKAVLSVRTHDFVPQISVVELNGEASPEQLLPALEKAFEKYKTDLPVKVMDKLKKEKTSVKRQPSKTAVETKATPSANSVTYNQTKAETKSVESAVTKAEDSQAAAVKPTESGNSNQADAIKNKKEDSPQRNLFGF